MLQVVSDDVIRDAEVTSYSVARSGEWPPPPPSACGTPPTQSTLTRCVRSFSDVTSGPDDDVTPPAPSELYARLREVLHDNARLKILLWGNKIDRWILQSPTTRLRT